MHCHFRIRNDAEFVLSPFPDSRLAAENFCCSTKEVTFAVSIV